MYLLDTDTIIYILKGESRAIENLNLHVHHPLHTTSVTLMELYDGAYKSQKVAANLSRVRMLEQWLSMIVPGKEMAETFGMLKAGLESQGQTLDDFDLIIASCALAWNFILVTNNTKHFERIEGLKLANWSV